jgi:Raf kinase inhibitor-like YbhB/YbcL family protein
VHHRPALRRIAALLVAAVVGCGGRSGEEGLMAGKTAAALQVTTSAFEPGGTIPPAYTGDGEDRSPPLAWQGVPAGTASFVILCDDPDASRGTWVHWVMYDIDPAVTAMGAGITDTPTIGGAAQGRNDFGNLGYGGPAPPRGKPHRYFFRVLALDRKLGLAPGATMKEVLAAAEGHILARGEVMGRYGR